MHVKVFSMRLRRAALSGLLLSVFLSACWSQTAPVPSVSNAEIATRIAGSSAPIILDVRSPEEFSEGRIPGAVNIPYDALEERLAELAAGQDDEIIVYCRSGRRAVIAEEILVAAGYRNVRDLEGHMIGWDAAGLATEK